MGSPKRIETLKPKITQRPFEWFKRTLVPPRLPDGSKSKMASPRTARKVIVGALAAGVLGGLAYLTGPEVLAYIEMVTGDLPPVVDGIIIGVAIFFLDRLAGRQANPDPQDDLAR